MVFGGSTYAYLDEDVFEDYIGMDLSTIDATVFSDANVTAIVTAAEEFVNAHLGVSAAQTVTNALTVCTKLYARLGAERILNGIGYYETDTYTLPEREVIALVKDLLRSNDLVGVDSIPVSGANRW